MENKNSSKNQGKTFNKTTITNGEINIVLKTDTFKNPTYNITIIIGQTSQYKQAIYTMNLTKNTEKTVKTQTQLLSESNNDNNQTMKVY